MRLVLWPSLIVQMIKTPAMQETWVQSLAQENTLEKETAIQSSILAWRIPLIKEFRRLQSWCWKEFVTTEWITFSFSCDLSWRMFHMHLKKVCFLLLLDGMPYLDIQSLFGLQFSSVTQSCLTLYTPMNHSMPVHHQLPKSTQTYVHWVGDVIQSSHLLLSPSPPALNLSQHQGLFQWVSSLHQVAKVLEFQLQHQSFQWTPKTDLP